MKHLDNRPWENTALSHEERASLLMAEMTLEERVGQLGSIWLGFSTGSDTDSGGDADNVPVIVEVSQQLSWEETVKDGLGHFTRMYGTKPVTVQEGMKKVIEYQNRVIKETRLGIPATVHEECLTGFTTMGATSFPTPLGLAATFNEDVIEAVSDVIGRDMRSVGVHHGLSPVLDLVRDYRWGRVEETMGEDPYLAAVAGSAYVRGLEKNGIVATLKHFAGHSSPRVARNHGPVSMGWREMYDFMLPPFEIAIREGNVGSVMNSYTDVDGIPCASSVQLLTTVLHDELGFDGVVVSDYWAVSFLEHMHRVAGSKSEAAALAVRAGIDVELPSTRCYGDDLVAAVKSGLLEARYVDRSCLRVLIQKSRQGLLDAGWDPQRDMSADLETVDLDSAANRQVALGAARESVILLENKNGILPLSQKKMKIAVIGPCADDGAAFLGCYSFANHVMAQHEDLGMGIEVPTLKSSLQKMLPDSEITFVAAVPVKDFDTSGIAQAKSAVDAADIAIYVVGDRAGLFGRGTSGEGNDVADLKLPGAQAEMLHECLGSKTPGIIVSVSGRPYSLGQFVDRAQAIIQAFMPGEEGGTAIAEVITGAISPSGRLPVEIPSTPTGQPSTYLQPKYGTPGLGMSTVDSVPLFTFGHGLTYTTFQYSALEISSNQVKTDGSFEAKVTVTNTGSRDGSELVQIYFEDPVAEVARPVIQLLGFAKVALKAGEKKTVTFTVHTDRLAYTGIEYKKIVDPGKLIISVGSSRSQLFSSKDIELVGPVRKVPFDRVMRTPVSINS
ncbi:BglX Beta-glucosidase-related glycosidases [Candidatus Nanopelagicaceae bacterium]